MLFKIKNCDIKISYYARIICIKERRLACIYITEHIYILPIYIALFISYHLWNVNKALYFKSFLNHYHLSNLTRAVSRISEQGQ